MMETVLGKAWVERADVEGVPQIDSLRVGVVGLQTRRIVAGQRAGEVFFPLRDLREHLRHRGVIVLQGQQRARQTPDRSGRGHRLWERHFAELTVVVRRSPVGDHSAGSLSLLTYTG